MARDALRNLVSDRGAPPEDPPEEPGLWGSITSFFGGGAPDESARFRTSGPFGLSQGPALRMRPAEQELFAGLAEQGYAPSQAVPMEVGESATQVGRYTLPEEAGGAIQEGAIRLAPIREGIGEGARYNARSRSGGRAAAEEVAHDLTLSDTTRSQRIARQVASRHDANADSLANLMTTSFDEEYSNRPQEKVAKSMTPAVMAIGGVRDSSGVDPMQLDLAGQLLDAHQNVPEGRRSALINAIESRQPGVRPADPIQ